MSHRATAGDPGDARAAAERRRATRRRRWRIAGGVAVVLGLVLAVGGVVVYQKLDGNIDRVDVAGQLFNRPAKSPLPSPAEGEEAPREPLNILLIGSDTRQGRGNGIDNKNPGQRSDTTVLVHLAADRSFAYGVSIARDTMVERPDCYSEGGTVIPGALYMWNAAYEEGGAACVVQQTEQLTGIRIDDFVEIDFRGFRQMVDALGGVTVCVPDEVNDTTGNITLPAGTYEVEGQQALDYVRVRYSVGNGSDVGRMKRQQAFMASMVNEAMSAGTLANPIKLYNFLDAATSSLTISSGLGSLRQLGGLANQFNGIGLQNVQFTSVPIRTYAPDPNRLEWKPKAAGRLWDLIRTDQPLDSDERLARDAVSAAGAPGASPSDGEGGGGAGGTGSDASASPEPETEAAAQRRVEEAAANGLCA